MLCYLLFLFKVRGLNRCKIFGHEVTGGRGSVTKPSHGVAWQGTVEPKREAFGAKLRLAPKTTRDASGPFKSLPRNHKKSLDA